MTVDLSQETATLCSTKAASTPVTKTLPEFRLYSPRAEHPNWAELAREAKEIAADVRSRSEPPAGRVTQARRKASAYKTALRNYRLNRVLHREGRGDLRPMYVLWTLLRSCNFRCTYCDDHMGRKYPDLSDDGVLDTDQASRLLQIMRTGTSSVYLSGGEPTLRKDLPQIARHAWGLGYYPIIINTNASALHVLLRRDAWRTFLADIDIVIVSLDALDLELLRSMWVYRRPQEVLRNLLVLRELAREYDFKLLVNTVIQPGQISEARSVLDLANDLDLWFTPVPVNTVASIDQRLLSDPEYRELVETILKRQREGYRITGSSRFNSRLLRSEHLHCRNTLKPHVDYDGRLIWPCKSTRNVEPIYINVLDFETVDQIYEYGRSRIDPTGFQGTAANQCGGQCNWAQNYSTDATVYGLENPASLLREVLRFVESG